MRYRLGTIWSEFEIVRLREGSAMVVESVLMQTMIAAVWTGKFETYNKMIGKVRDGR
jgi:hypothetical protein